jgi:hypothetical protein
VLFDETLPLAGQVKDGVDFTKDLLWFNDTTKIEGAEAMNFNFASESLRDVGILVMQMHKLFLCFS